MVEFRVIVGGGKPWRPNLETDAAWHARFATGDRITASFDRIEAKLQAILDHLDGRRPLKGRPMSEERDAHIRALVQQLSDQRREAAQYDTHRRIRRLEAELEHSLPADVPLHKRGFGVMEDPAQ